MGHDAAAAAAMGQVRSLLRAVAVHDGGGPAEVLRATDRVLRSLGVETTATVVVVQHAFVRRGGWAAAVVIHSGARNGSGPDRDAFDRRPGRG